MRRNCGLKLASLKHSLLDGAIAQLGERVLCKHEVVGSIPSGSTRWRSAIVGEASLNKSFAKQFALRPYGSAARDF